MPDDYTMWSPIVLKPSWKREEEDYTVTLMKLTDGTLRKENYPQDNGTKGFEHLTAATFPGFENTATRLNFEGVLARNVGVT